MADGPIDWDGVNIMVGWNTKLSLEMLTWPVHSFRWKRLPRTQRARYFIAPLGFFVNRRIGIEEIKLP